MAYVREPLIPSCNLISYNVMCELWIPMTLTDPFKNIIIAHDIGLLMLLFKKRRLLIKLNLY